MSYVSRLREIGSGIAGIAVTDTLYVSPNGAGTNGKTWAGAFTTLQAALAAASADADDLTLILIGPHATTYDINTTGDPTYTGNYDIKGSHRNWAKITNTHASATSIMKFTGKVSLENLTFDPGATSINGVIISGAGTTGARVRHVYFENKSVTGAQTALEISGGTEYSRVEDVKFHGTITRTTGLILDNCALGNFERLDFHDCLVGLQITNAGSDSNIFTFVLFHVCTLAMDLDAGNTQYFHEIEFGECTTNVDDEVKDHSWTNIRGHFPIEIDPDDLDGETVTTGTAGNYGNALTIFSTGEIDAPFRIVGVTFEPATSEWYQVRFSGDAGSTYFDIIQFDGTRREGIAAPSGTEFIFNAGTELYCEARNESGGDNCQVWVEIQKI